MTTVYEYDDDFQAKIAALVLRDSLFNQRTLGLVDSTYLTNAFDSVLAKVGINYYQTYKRTPSLPIMKKLVAAIFAKKIIRDDLKPELLQRLGRLLKEDINDRDFIVDEIASFAKHQALENAIIDSVDLLKAKNFAAIEALVKKASMVGVTQGLGEYDYFAEIANRTQERRDKIAGLIKPTGISTGYPAMDDFLFHKGWGRGELSVLMGGAKAGKTMALIEFAKCASLQGYNTLYITCEVAARIISERLDANLSSTPIRTLEGKFIDVDTAIKALAATAGKLIVREFPSGHCAPADIRRLLAYYAAHGIRFDLIVVDYADIMRPDFRSQDPIENSKQVYLELRAISQEERAAMLTATQTNRDGFKAAVARAEHAAEDFNKVRIADLLISINSTDEERAMGEARLFFAAMRNSESGFTLRIKQALERARFLERVMGKE